MADIDALAGEIGKLFTGVAKDIYEKFKQEDRDELASYAKKMASIALALRTESDPARRAALVDNLNTYENAARLMVARYEIVAASSLEKAGIEALTLVLKSVAKIVIAAV